MLIGVPAEIKDNEYRVAISPTGVRELIAHGHQVLVETKAGYAIGFDDAHYLNAGGHICTTAQEIFSRADLIVKVKEPQLHECSMLQPGKIIFSYLHLAAVPDIARALLDSGCIAIAYETVTDASHRLPLLAPMSEVAGRMAVQAGAHCLEKSKGGRGVLLSGVPGVAPGKVVILGGGVAGANAARVAAGMGAEVVILERSLTRLRELEEIFGSHVRGIFSTAQAIEHHVLEADLVIGAVLIPGAAAPKLISKDLVKRMHRGAVIVDVAIDQGGCCETSKPTTHASPIYIAEEVVHYCVTNIPGAVARTSTRALENATLSYIIALADSGYRQAFHHDPGFKDGLNIYRGRITHEAVAQALNLSYSPASTLLGS